MKKRNLFLTLGLALTLGAGVAGGLSVNRGEAKEVEATVNSPYSSVYLVGSMNDWLSGKSASQIYETYEYDYKFRYVGEINS